MKKRILNMIPRFFFILYMLILCCACNTLKSNNNEQINTVNNDIVSDNDEEIIEFISFNELKIKPIIPKEQILKKIIYPEDALKNKIEGTVYLELFISRNGEIKKIIVLKDPGYGFVDTTLAAFNNILCIPAKDEYGNPVNCRYRYPVRFVLPK